MRGACLALQVVESTSPPAPCKRVTCAGAADGYNRRVKGTRFKRGMQR
jgi:hypothetical protein